MCNELHIVFKKGVYMTQTTEGAGPGSVTRVLPKIFNGVVKTENIPPSTVVNTDIADNSVTTNKLANGAVTVAKMKVFKSEEVTGNGNSQNIAHGLNAIPSVVMVFPTEAGDNYTVVEGSHTSTNVVVTVANGKKYKVVAFA
jgi:hypothetical protein